METDIAYKYSWQKVKLFITSLLHLTVVINIENYPLQIIPSSPQENTYTDYSQHWL